MLSVLIVGWFYLATIDYETIYMRGPFASKALCMQHEADSVPMSWESTGCRLKSINMDDTHDLSPIAPHRKQS